MLNLKKIKLLKDSKIGGTIIRAGNYVFVNAFDFKRLIGSGAAEDVSAVPLSATASDVYSWAKQPTKPSYIWVEIGGRPTVVSAFINDSGYLTNITKAQVEAVLTGLISSHTHAYVPYVGGTSNVDLGLHSLTVDVNSLFVDSINHRVGILSTTPTAAFSVNDKAAISQDGGIMVKLINRTGGITVKGTIVSADVSNEESFYTTPSDGDMPIGIVYESGVGNGSSAWVVVSGIAEVLFKDAVAPTRGYVAFVSNVAGRADVSASVPASLTHWREIGHPIQTKSAGTNVIAKVVLHFN